MNDQLVKDQTKQKCDLEERTAQLAESFIEPWSLKIEPLRKSF